MPILSRTILRRMEFARLQFTEAWHRIREAGYWKISSRAMFMLLFARMLLQEGLTSKEFRMFIIMILQSQAKSMFIELEELQELGKKELQYQLLRREIMKTLMKFLEIRK